MLEIDEEIDETHCQHQPKFYCDRCKRSEKLLQDRLAWYTESFHYDCTIRVGRENSKLFKCHKIVLASSSEAFASMLYGNFDEGSKKKDDPVTLDVERITPESFDLAMRYIYGDAENFQTVSIACEVYEFARLYMIEDVMHAAAKKMKAAAPHEILQVYETFKYLDKSDELKDTLKTIARNTNEVLSSPQWVEAAPSTVLDIFKEPVLKVKSEKYLYEALITWGEKNSEAASDLRPMIDSALKQIRFMTFSSFEFSELCLMNANILTTEEQLQIFMSISRDDPTQLPPNFSVCKSDRKERVYFNLGGFRSIYHSVTEEEVNWKSLRSRIIFSITAKNEPKPLVFITGVDLACLIHEKNKGLAADLTCILKKDESGEQVAKALFKGTIGVESTGVTFAEPVLLDQSSWYEISVQYLNRQSLNTEKYKYRNPPTWLLRDCKGQKLEHKHRDQITHVDICDFHYFYI